MTTILTTWHILTGHVNVVILLLLLCYLCASCTCSVIIIIMSFVVLMIVAVTIWTSLRVHKDVNCYPPRTCSVLQDLSWCRTQTSSHVLLRWVQILWFTHVPFLLDKNRGKISKFHLWSMTSKTADDSKIFCEWTMIKKKKKVTNLGVDDEKKNPQKNYQILTVWRCMLREKCSTIKIELIDASLRRLFFFYISWKKKSSKGSKMWMADVSNMVCLYKHDRKNQTKDWTCCKTSSENIFFKSI